MFYEFSGKVKDLQARPNAFMEEFIYPQERAISTQVQESDQWEPVPIFGRFDGRAGRMKFTLRP